MRKVLISGAVGDVSEFFEVSRATFDQYAERHGYVADYGPWNTRGRDAYWMKLAAILKVWGDYDFILWVDADVLIQDDAPDILDAIPDDKALGAVEHITHEGMVFNVGVMGIRTTERAHEMFQKAWDAHDRFASHKWPDQAPVMELLGYTTDIPVVRGLGGEYRDVMHLLDLTWNSLPRFGQYGHFLHFAGMQTRERFTLLRQLIGDSEQEFIK